MARVTIEDCLKQVDNRFSLVHMAIKRVKQFREGAPPLIESKNREIVVALREIAKGLVTPKIPEELLSMEKEREEDVLVIEPILDDISLVKIGTDKTDVKNESDKSEEKEK